MTAGKKSDVPFSSRLRQGTSAGHMTPPFRSRRVFLGMAQRFLPRTYSYTTSRLSTHPRPTSASVPSVVVRPTLRCASVGKSRRRIVGPTFRAPSRLVLNHRPLLVPPPPPAPPPPRTPSSLGPFGISRNARFSRGQELHLPGASRERSERLSSGFFILNLPYFGSHTTPPSPPPSPPLPSPPLPLSSRAAVGGAGAGGALVSTHPPSTRALVLHLPQPSH
ncbi:uncharacterized protein SCHCODRAFT_02241462 [Schizophyllum commune H4-8]|uniref:uncharacterized protein n=1 Tax=Schizophyllum commune (strain H4-8 / FGSC 9210) TaxID=578458 RepID=UPI00215EB121|nr:uncharacterized protein SCHCODRAFT_02241462 [Schizophyllum commune H4-8]KAI5895863.1 hypothetical protein SCHCODRAFT_02241462 [Schizophyllum commune H4-8]